MAHVGNDIEEIFRFIIATVVLIFIIAIFYSIPGPLGDSFRTIINEIIVIVIFLVAIFIAIRLFSR